jgi:hypothetical protein
MLMSVGKNFFDYAYVSPENFLDLPPPATTIFRKNFYDLGKILGNVSQNMTTPPNVDGFATSTNTTQ